MMAERKAYLVGHGNSPIEEFIRLLKKKEIDTLVDVRSTPYSKYASQFNSESLKEKLLENEISCVYLGDLLGGRPPEGFSLDSEKFRKGIEKLLELIERSTVVIMCSEADYRKCHRRFMGLRLIEEGSSVEYLDIGGGQKALEF